MMQCRLCPDPQVGDIADVHCVCQDRGTRKNGKQKTTNLGYRTLGFSPAMG